MSEILLVNPRRRRKARKMSAKQAKYFGKRRRRKSRASVASAPRRRRRRRSTSIVHTNPRRRRRSSLTRSVRRRRHHNPSLRGLAGGAVPMLKAGAIGAAGALGLDVLWGYGKGYLPASIAGSPLAQYAVKLAGALLVGIVGNKVLRGKGRDMAVGATTVVLHDAMKAQLQNAFPTLPLGEYLTYAPTVGRTRRAGRLMSTGMSGVGEYLSGIPDQTNDGCYSGDYNGDGINGY
jgi:hypothetical protein